MTGCFLGLDTSNYTTSAALCDESGRILWNQKRLLPVREGERGLRQSDAVFLHIKALEETADALRAVLSNSAETVRGVGYSVSPRDTEGSYMPCFLVGSGIGRMLSASMGIPGYAFSHQAGHLMAAAHSVCCQNEMDLSHFISSPFLAFHVSGGTTDILFAEPDEEQILRVQRLGGTLDINAGQLIDRLGVRMGLSFPCGAAMDRMAMEYQGKVPKAPVTVKGMDCNLSGLENKALQLLESTGSQETVSAYVLRAVASTLVSLTENLLQKYPGIPVIYAGGVMSSCYIRKFLEPYGLFAEAVFSSDNAAGTALLAREAWRRNNGR